MSPAVIILIISILIVLIAIGIGIYFVFFRKTPTTNLQPAPVPSNPGGFTGLNPINPGGFTGLNPIDPGGFTGLNPIDPGGFTGLNPIDTPCQNYINSVLAQNNLSNRWQVALDGVSGSQSTICLNNNSLDFWLLSNAVIYSNVLILQEDINGLANAYNSFFNGVYPNGITNNPAALNASLWAIRALPTNSNQLQQFRAFWTQPIPDILQPKGPKPPLYPTSL